MSSCLSSVVVCCRPVASVAHKTISKIQLQNKLCEVKNGWRLVPLRGGGDPTEWQMPLKISIFFWNTSLTYVLSLWAMPPTKKGILD